MRWLAAPLIAALALALSPAEQGGTVKATYTLGHPIHGDIELEDLSGTTHRLLEEHRAGILVLVFWSLRDPTARVYEKRLEELQKRYAKRDVKIVLVDSNHNELVSSSGTDPVDKIRAHVKKAKLTLPVYLDRGNIVADRFGALCTNHAFIVDRKRTPRYSGGIDDDPKGQKPADRTQHWLREALDTVVAGNTPEFPLTRPKGRKISRAPKAKAPK
jgi:hypothetical protein